MARNDNRWLARMLTSGFLCRTLSRVVYFPIIIVVYLGFYMG